MFQIIWRTLAAVVILFLLTKALGKRQISELSMFEYITGISIGNIAAYVSLDLENMWYLGIVSLAVWVVVSVGIEYWTMKSKKVRNFIDGKGTVLIRDGRLFKDKLHKERLTLDELLEQLRKKDVYRVADVEFAVMESSGELNIQLKKQFQPITPDMLGWRMGHEGPPHTIVMDGQVIHDELQLAGKDEKWLEHELQRHKLRLEEIFLSQLGSDGSVSFQTIDGRNVSMEKKSNAKDKVMTLTNQMQEELRRLERLAQNESDRKLYRSAQFHLRQGTEAIQTEKRSPSVREH
ncbi:DUF421 domain-containing protein [Paenibacillus sp. PL2-23]|uniref:DUF421 domain-containing protein n=1 Tax=Paenibacillus sp. PL2-23 TaxID=2100729 RepID=UPI0030F54E49